MTSKYDVRILFGQPKENLGELFTKSCDDLITPPEGILFNYKVDTKKNEGANLNNMFSSYNIIVNELISKGWKPDLIHAHCSANGGVIANYLGNNHNIPTMITEHQMFLLNNYSIMLQNMIFKALEDTNFVGAVSTDKMKFILMHGIKCNPVVLGNMVDDSIFKIKHKKRKNKKFNILIVAGASFIKDLPTFFYSIKELVNRNHKDIHAKIVGNGIWGGESYSELVKKLKLEKYCTFIDIVERKEMPNFYQESDVFVSTSIAEGFQVSILEAMACGKPVVSTSHGGAEDIISPENGIIVKIRDYKSIAEALINIKTGKVIYNSEIIRSTVVSQYGKVAFRKKISKIYDSLIKK
jgi:glycosyltransferase involved in cell wall biosynthesis